MNAEYIIEGGKKLRCGFTTGSAAAGAAKAACVILITGKSLETISIETLAGTELVLTLDSVQISEEQVVCSIRKDAGDDPDITHNIPIYARVKKNSSSSGIRISGGEGVGVVTKKGLACKVGEAAINPGPRRMIYAEIQKVLPPGMGVDVEISVPGGQELALKTLNPELGIVGGISILGTTGIVVPMSEEAFKESLALSLSILKEEGTTAVVLVPGNYGRDFAENQLKLPGSLICVMSNFVGFMLDKALYYGMQEILLVGHPGKLVKVAGGIFHTHSKVADARLEILTALYVRRGNDLEVARRILNSNTIEEAVDYIDDPAFFDFMADVVKEKCEKRSHKKIHIHCVLFSLAGNLLGMSRGAREMLTFLSNK